MSTVIIVGLVFLVGFIIALYATIKTKSTKINTYEPFKEWVGKTVSLNKETVLFKEKVQMNANDDYPYILLDSLHPQWKYINEQKEIGDIIEIARFEEGTQLKLDKAIQYTNGVSGSSYPSIFGTLHAHGKTYKIGYRWGEQDIAKQFDKVDKSWFFHQAPWQDVKDTVFYAVPTAKFW